MVSSLAIATKSILSVAGPAFFLGLQGSSVKTALTILSEKSVGKLSLLPFASLLTNCVLWSFYGILKHDNTVMIPNGLGVLSGLVCSSIYLRFASNIDIATVAVSVALMIFAYSLFRAGDFNMLGSIGCLLAVILMGSPLATLSTVIRDKSTDSMPFTTSFTTWCNAFSWSLYGLIVAHDFMIYGPNLVGLALASIQMSLYLIYPSTAASKIPASKSEKDISRLF